MFLRHLLQFVLENGVEKPSANHQKKEDSLIHTPVALSITREPDPLVSMIFSSAVKST